MLTVWCNMNLCLHSGALAYRLLFANFCSPQSSTLVVRGYGMLSSLICLGRDWREPKRSPISFPCNLLCPCHLGIFQHKHQLLRLINYSGLLLCIFQVLLSGCSAGGLATFFHCDSLKERLGGIVTVKCLSDAGFFLDL